ncbi:bone morphogenetic protein 10-like [Anoplophora glabripennis]|uniref:bone morphogenetic protein 10-like n=1 Tax=Anoplophora glabripennis TaxID=217634 RepID=UPI0008758F05|nr:bone morphogenetic protein 10-like [Anoplophora glabripennis]
MYVSLIILIPMLICLWVYFLILVRESIIAKSSTSIQLNIIDAPGIPTKYWAKNSTSGDSIKGGVVPKKKKLIHVPKFMLELYEKNKIEGNANTRPDVVRSVIPTQTGPIYGNEILEELSDNHLLIFDLPTTNDDEKFIRAELKILTLLDVNTDDEKGVRKILKVSVYDDQIKKLFHHQETQIHHVNNTWVSFDVTAPVNKIYQTNSKSKVLKIVISICAFFPSITKNLKLSLMPIQEDFEHDYPVLLLSYSSMKEGTDSNKKLLNIKKNRKKRSLEDDYEEETNRLWDDEFSNKRVPVKKVRKSRNTCRRKPLYIDFSEINYDVWIVQPSGYDAYQCQGRCFYPVAEHLNPTKHAIVQALLHSVAPSKVSRSCCVPTILDSISILYVDTNGVLTYRYAYKDMVVVECGCR